MADVKYKIKIDQKPTEAQIAEIEEAKKKPIVFDEDCPEITEENTPELYEAMKRAVIARNQRINSRKKILA